MAGRIVVHQLIAQGGLSEIWLAKRGDSHVVIKAFRRDPTWSDSEAEECLGYFRNEARWLAEVRHPDLVRGLGVLHTTSEPALLLEFNEGMNLRQWLDAHHPPRSLDTFYRMSRGVACAVRFLHGRRLMHRDVAPRNVMVMTGGETRLLDLQFVRQAPACADLMARPLSHGLGDWAFAAPELMDLLDDPYDERVDLYSLGAVLIELLVNRPPRRRAPSECRRDVPRGLSALLWAMVDELPGNRPDWETISRVLHLPQMSA